MVGVGTSQGSNRRSQQRSGSGRVSNESVRQETGTGMQVTRYRCPWKNKNTHQGTDCRSGHPLNTTCNQSQVFWLTAGLSL
ncbi:unnamed protein product [Staurois parvus]|uniref:Uncharacterized protein n=1 Tax=Staurois parvus TaxID=386267 RepID=A0ABN9BQ98_9NEOB|nr:unnamed protein product [Staurois parvus]